MYKKNEVFLIVLLFVFSLLLSGCTDNTDSYVKEKYVRDDAFNREWSYIQHIASNFSEKKEYIRGIYDCDNYTRDLIVLFKDRGYYAENVTGWFNMNKICSYGSECDYKSSNTKCITGRCYRRHMWLRVYLKQKDYVFGYDYSERTYVDIEPKSGFIIHPDRYTEDDYIED